VIFNEDEMDGVCERLLCDLCKKENKSKKNGNQQSIVLPFKKKSNISLVQQKRTSVPSVQLCSFTCFVLSPLYNRTRF